MSNNGSSKKEKETQLQDRIQIILAEFLKEEDNKYCVDCDAKGPRWASWTLGVFLCIRCAGIHRNLGVHLSRVKSVNLDSWTPLQLAMMKEIGNSRGRAIYEANLEDNFRRPQTDSTLEQFIRAKYEHKRYIAKEWIAPNPSADIIADEIRKLEQNLHKKRTNYSGHIAVNKKDTESHVPRPEKSNINKVDINNVTTVSKVDLLGAPFDSDNVNDDTFGDFVFASNGNSSAAVNSAPSTAVSSAVDDLMGLNLGGGAVGNTVDISSLPSSRQQQQSSSVLLQSTLSGQQTTNSGPLDKNSILALYNNIGNNNMNISNTNMTQSATSTWPGIGVPNYQDIQFQQQQQYGHGQHQWISSAPQPQQQQQQQQQQQMGSFGTQHNPFFNKSHSSSAFSTQLNHNHNQQIFPTTSSDQISQQPNTIFW